RAGERPVLARLAVGGAGDPLRVGRERVGVHRVRVDAGHHVHPQRARARDELAERVAVAEVAAAVVVRDPRRVEGHVPARADARGVGPGPAHHVDPELRVELDRVVLGERELRPARGRPVPVGGAQVHLSPVVEMPRIRYFWAVTKNTSTGSSDSSDMANSAPTPLEVSELIIEFSATGTVNISVEVR